MNDQKRSGSRKLVRKKIRRFTKQQLSAIVRDMDFEGSAEILRDGTHVVFPEDKKMTKLRSYPKSYNLGHKAIADLFKERVVVQEKIDGSQFSFGSINGALFLRSKRQDIHPGSEDKLFKMAVATAVRLFEEMVLVPEWIYRAEAVTSPKHNKLLYERIPEGGLILFDVDVGMEDRVADSATLAGIGKELGLEVVPTLFEGEVTSLDDLKTLLDSKSILGDTVTVEGIVIKNYNRFDLDGKMLMGKWVRDDFKEKINPEYDKPSKKEFVQILIDELRTEARWEKAIQHLRDDGTLTDSPKDIGPLIKEIQTDTLEEEAEYIMERLFNEAKGHITRGIVKGFPEFYKARLLEKQEFGKDE